MAEHKHNENCKALLGNLSSFIDGELDDNLCQELQKHMQGCENCRVVYDTLTRTIYLYQANEREHELPDDVRGRLFSSLKLDDLIKPAA
ncbi:MAG: zf-HC2 domain-containing protein [Chloroflexota bacterium]